MDEYNGSSGSPHIMLCMSLAIITNTKYMYKYMFMTKEVL